jgi:hypothetical protein
LEARSHMRTVSSREQERKVSEEGQRAMEVTVSV